MNVERLRQVEAIFSGAIELPGADRASFLAEQCAGDAELRREVESLLGHASESIGMLDVPPVAAPLGATFSQEPARFEAALPADRRIGAYRVLKFLGAGGMGVVYLAEQERPRRTVALKVIRGSMASPSLVRRFEHEAEVLGRMHHPGIAQIYEAGLAETEHGPQPYLAMELVEGPPITDFVEARRLATGERLGLIARVCDAIHHAHQRGVIHRDLKPSNILVDAHGQPKILDFGVARAIDADIQVTTLRTSVGQLIGTLPYMSPEQVAADPAEIDNRADVYALGVLTFELLAGKLPYDLRSRSIPEAARIIRDEPPTRLSTVDRTLRGDIETIVAKAMAKEKERRYQTAAELADDLRRHLAGEPIAARESSASEMLRRSLRRYRGAAAAGTIVILSLAAVATYASIQSTRNRALALSEQSAREEESLARRQAEEQRRIATELNAQLRQQLRAGLIERGRAEGVAQNGPGAESVLWPELLADPHSRPAFWALWELSARFPCLWTTSVADGPAVVCASPDRRLIAVGTWSGTVHVLLAETGADVGNIGVETPARSAAVIAIFFTDPESILTVHANGYARRWRVRAGPFEATGAWRVAEGPVLSAACARDGSVLATATSEGSVSLWSLPEGDLIETRVVGAMPVDAIAFTAEADAIGIGARDGSLSVWPLEPGAERRTVGVRPEAYRSLAFSPDGLTLYAAMHTGLTVRWDLRGVDPPRMSPGSTDARRAEPDAEGRRLLVARNLLLTVEDLEEDRREVVGYPVNAFISGAWVGERIVTVEPSGAVRLWESGAWPALDLLCRHKSWVFGVEFSPAGDRVASASGDGTVGVWSFPGSEPISTLQLPPRHRSRMVRFNRDGTQIAAACSDGLIRLANPDTGEEVARLGPVGAEIYGLAYSPDFTRIAAAAVNGSVTVFDVASGAQVQHATGLNANARSVAYSPDGTRLYTSGSPEGVVIWDGATLERIGLLRTTTEPWSVAPSPDGKRVAVGTYGATVEFFDLATGARTLGIGRHHLVVAGLAFTRDGATLASGGDDGTIKLWDPTNARLLASLETAAGPIPGVAFSPDGRWLACGTGGGRAEVWDLTHHHRHLAANLESAISRFATDELPSENLELLRLWMRAVLAGEPSEPGEVHEVGEGGDPGDRDG